MSSTKSPLGRNPFDSRVPFLSPGQSEEPPWASIGHEHPDHPEHVPEHIRWLMQYAPAHVPGQLAHPSHAMGASQPAHEHFDLSPPRSESGDDEGGNARLLEWALLADHSPKHGQRVSLCSVAPEDPDGGGSNEAEAGAEGNPQADADEEPPEARASAGLDGQEADDEGGEDEH